MSLVDSLEVVKSFILQSEEVNIDNILFKLHYSVTTTFLIGFSILLGISQFAGAPIHCQRSWENEDEMSEEAFNLFCWVQGVVTRKDSAFSKSTLQHLGNLNCSEEDQCWTHTYYIWVPFFLVFQAGCFYIPRIIWSYNEGGKLKGLLNKFNKKCIIRGLDFDRGIDDKISDLVEYMIQSRKQNGLWAGTYYICEGLNLLNVYFQFELCDKFFNGKFLELANETWDFDEHSESTLPVTGSCIFRQFGLGGHAETIEGICVLPHNVLTRKFYSLFNFWLSLLLVISAGNLTFRFLMIFFPELREISLNYYYGVKLRSLGEEGLIKFCRQSHGNWFLFCGLVSNMSGLVKYNFIKKVEKAFEADWNS